MEDLLYEAESVSGGFGRASVGAARGRSCCHLLITSGRSCLRRSTYLAAQGVRLQEGNRGDCGADLYQEPEQAAGRGNASCITLGWHKRGHGGGAQLQRRRPTCTT